MTPEAQRPKLQRRINRVKEDGVVVRYLTERMFKRVVKCQPVRIQIGGVIVEVRSKHQKELKRLSELKAEMKALREKIK